MTHDFGLIISDLYLAIALRSYDLGKLLNDLNMYTRIKIYNFVCLRCEFSEKWNRIYISTKDLTLL